jgi:hypothetical protein
MFTHPGHFHKHLNPNKKNKKNSKKNPKQKPKSEKTTLRAIQNLKLFKTSGPNLKLNYNINNKIYPILMNAV